MLLERLWVRREASPPAPDLAIVRDTEDMGNPMGHGILKTWIWLRCLRPCEEKMCLRRSVHFLFRVLLYLSDRATRATELGRLHLRRPRLAATKRSFSYRVAAAWNRLSPEQCDAGTVRAFKAMLIRDHVF